MVRWNCHVGTRIDSDASGGYETVTETSYLIDPNNHTGYAQVIEQRRDDNGDGAPENVRSYVIGLDGFLRPHESGSLSTAMFVDAPQVPSRSTNVGVLLSSSS